jgi:peptidoglycan/LPS O-acetylase OafA/YrhL
VSTTVTAPSPGTRQRLDHIDAMRPLKQAAVISTHALIFMVPVADVAAGNNLLILTHFSREAFLFVSSCMLAYSYRELNHFGASTYWKRRFLSVGAPYLAWTLIYFVYTSLVAKSSFPYYSFSESRIFSVAGIDHLANLTASGYYHLYYLIVIMEFYVLFPVLLRLVRRFDQHHAALMALALLWQVLNALFWPDIYGVAVRLHVASAGSQTFWESRLVTSYALYIVAGIVVAMHLQDVHAWIINHRALIVVGTLMAGAGAIGLNQLSVNGFPARLVYPGTDPFAIIVIPYYVGAILSIYLLGVFLVDARRTRRTRSIVKSGSDNSYGIYLSQMIWIPLIVRFHVHHFTHVPWPLVVVVTIVVVYALGFLFTALVARTALARVLTGRSRVPWRTFLPRRSPTTPLDRDVADGPLDVGLLQ